MQSRVKSLLIFFVIVAGLAVVSKFNSRPYSLSLASVSVTLSNSRPSFKGALAAGNFVGTSRAIINTTANAYPSTSSAQLQQGDTVAIGEAGSLEVYTVASTSANNAIYLDAPSSAILLAGDADTGDDVISTVSSSLTVKFTTANALEGGRFRVLVPALTDDPSSADGIPDSGYFDMLGATTTCPTNINNANHKYDFQAGTATRSAITIAARDYHSFECAYSNTGGNGTDFGTTYTALTINSIINPAPAAAHTAGVADSHRIIVQHLDSSFATVDQTTVAVGVIEAVRVTATVAPQITFKILGLASGVSTCGITTNVTTSPTLIPFGELLISGYTYAAQALTVSTNAFNGYVVTAKENDQLGRENGACGDGNNGTAGTDDDPDSTNPNYNTCIIDARGNTNGDPIAGSMSHIAHAIWDSASSTNKGFGFSIDNLNSVVGMTVPFQYSSTTGSCSTNGSFANKSCYKQFADAENNEGAETLFEATAPADNHNINVCYKAVISTTQAAGEYENFITYTATAKF